MLSASTAGAAGLPSGSGREVLLCWLAGVAAANEVRCKGGEYSALQHLLGAPDGFMLTLTAAVLRLTKPFVSGYLTQNPKFCDLLTKHLNPSYYASHGHRLGSAVLETTLSGQRGSPADAAAGSSSTCGGQQHLLAADPAAAAAAASFISEVFFVAQRYLHVGLMPAVHRYTKLYAHLWERYSAAAADAAAAAGGSAQRTPPPPELSLLHDCSVAQLLQPDMTADAVQFAVLEIVWLADMLSSKQQLLQQQQQLGGVNNSSSSSSVLSLVPESVLSDAAAWLTFVIQQGQSEQLAAVPIGLLMRSLVTVLEHPSEVRSLLVVAKVVQLLLVMLAPQVNLERRTRGALGRSNLSPGEMALVASVLGTSAAQQQLAPALMRIYGQADFVVGLDVDRDDYDKFTMRHQIDQILEELWRDERCRECIRQHATASAAAAAAGAAAGPGSAAGGLFAGFVSAVLNDLMYLFKDSLERLADVKQIEDSKADAAAWSALADDVRADKQAFYRGQQRTAGGFMALARTTLDLLNTLSGDVVIARTFLQQPLLGKTAYAALHFMELLVGPRCQSLQVANPKRYNFDRQALLLSMVQLTTQLGKHAEFLQEVLMGNTLQLALQLGMHAWFLQALAEEPEFDPKLLQAAVDLLNASHAYAAADSLAAVLAAAVARTSAARGGQQSKRQRTSQAGGPAGGTNAGADTDATAAAAAAEMEADGVLTPEAVEAEVSQLVAAWGTVVGEGPGSYEEAEGAYAAALQPLSVGVFDAAAAGAFNSQFSAMAAQPEGDASQKLRRLGRELRDLRGKTSLPVAAAAACFVWQDEERPDKVRCVISGPQDTPYEGGLFVFDVYFPPGYPNVPPLMVLETTGEGRARFNPNLYADGKVCLSLLGTWHGGDEASKWNPNSSSLFQILLSIQGMIFVEDPYFNEPNVERMRGTSEGTITSMRYNAELRLHTLRWAVLDLLKKAPPGLQDVVSSHFRVLRGVLAARAGRWLREAARADPSGTFYRRMVIVMGEVVERLAEL
ncbi:ubiquitin elongating factor core-domain-containing protein [Scenedesmus sp. NREL 46B-D3]|nr:ubiquitin elongating factor core-domain-containing protein [Scenedesmus sp. NREL 46B-D3]